MRHIDFMMTMMTMGISLWIVLAMLTIVIIVIIKSCAMSV